jgi:replicative DNA helicase
MTKHKALSEALRGVGEAARSGVPAPAYRGDLLTLYPGQLCIVGAPPGSGKSAFCMAALASILERTESLKAVVISSEMSAQVTAARLLAARAQVSCSRIIDRTLSKGDHLRTVSAEAELAPILDRVRFVETNQISEVAAAYLEDPYDILLIDYLQAMSPIKPGKDQDQRIQVSSISGLLVEIAAQGVAVLSISAVARQRGRGGSSYDNLGMASFRDSSSIEYAADSAYIMLTRPDSDQVLMQQVKSRHGRSEDLTYHWARTTMAYLKLAAPDKKDIYRGEGLSAEALPEKCTGEDPAGGAL